MTWIGYGFWGIVVTGLFLAYYMERKFGTKGPKEDLKTTTHQEITRVTHNNEWPHL